MNPAQAANPALGVLIFALGGLAGAVFYLPFKKVRNWAWESYWLVYAVIGLLIVPLALALGHVAERRRGASGVAAQRVALLLPLRRDVGRGRPDVGPDDPLPRRRPGPGAGLRHHLRGGHPGPATAGGRFRPPLRAGAGIVSFARRHGFARRHRHRRHRRACRRNGSCPRRRRRSPWRSSTSTRASWRRSSPA